MGRAPLRNPPAVQTAASNTAAYHTSPAVFPQPVVVTPHHTTYTNSALDGRPHRHAKGCNTAAVQRISQVSYQTGLTRKGRKRGAAAAAPLCRTRARCQTVRPHTRTTSRLFCFFPHRAFTFRPTPRPRRHARWFAAKGCQRGAVAAHPLCRT
eukprot:145965-Chlamydomonas_euryale.AAC.3